MSQQPSIDIKSLRGIWNDSSVQGLKKAYLRVNILKKMECVFSKNPKASVLEFGPGSGCLLELIRERWPKADYHVADIDSTLLEDLSRKDQTLQPHFLAGSFCLESISGQFDMIVAVDVWEHLELSEALAYTAWSWQRLASGGRLILQMPNWGCPMTPATFYNDLTHRTPLNEESIRQLCISAGIPLDVVTVFPRRTPGALGFIRDRLNDLFGWFYRLGFVFFGSVRLKIFSADLVVLICKPNG